MTGKPAGLPQGNAKAYGKQSQGENYVSGGDSLQAEIGGAPEVILLQEVSCGRICNHNGSK